MSKIKVGDWVTVDAAAYIDITENKKYKVEDIIGECVEIIDDINDCQDININNVTLVPKTTPRPHAELRHRWLYDDKMVIQVWRDDSAWTDTRYPAWSPDSKYREKPTEPTERDLIMKEIQEAQDKLNAAKERLEEME